MASEGRVLEGSEIDHSQPVERCRSCGAPIRWGKTRTGAACPFDVVGGIRTHVTHFSTCPDAKRWTKR